LRRVSGATTIERNVTAVSLSQWYWAMVSHAGADMSAGNRETTARQVLHRDWLLNRRH